MTMKLKAVHLCVVGETTRGKTAIIEHLPGTEFSVSDEIGAELIGMGAARLVEVVEVAEPKKAKKAPAKEPAAPAPEAVPGLEDAHPSDVDVDVDFDGDELLG